MVNAYSTRSVGVFFRRAKFFARESAMLKLQIRGRNEGSQRGGGGRGKGDGAREEKESIFPLPPFVSFALAPNLRVAFSTLSNLPLSQNRKRRLQRNEHKQTAFQLRMHCRLE